MTKAVIAAKVTKIVVIMRYSKNKKRPMDCKKSRNMFVLRRTFDEAKLQRSVKDHCQITGRYRGAAHSESNATRNCE